MGPPAWLHCNLCMNQRCKALLMSSCGKVVCSDCKPKLQTSQCKSCKGPCNRTVELNSKTPKEVTRLFTDLSSELKSVFKSIDFQTNQKRQILQYKKKKLNYGRSVIAKRRNDWNMKKSQKMTLHHEIEKKEQLLVAQIERLKKKIAASSMAMSVDDRRSSGMVTGQSHQFYHNPIVNNKTTNRFTGNLPFSPIFGQAHMRSHGAGVMTHKISHDQLPGSQVLAGASELLNVSHRSEGDTRYGYGGGGGFLEMKTPAAWNKNKKFQSNFDKSEKIGSKHPLHVYKFFSP